MLTEADLPTDGGFIPLSGGPIQLPVASEDLGMCDGPNDVKMAKEARYVGAGTAVHLNTNTDGPSFYEVVYSFPNEWAAKRFVTASQHEIASCRSGWSRPIIPGDPPTDYKVKIVPFPKVGDQRFAAGTISTGGEDDLLRDPDLPTISDGALVHVGNNVVWVPRYGISVVMDDSARQLQSERQGGSRSAR